MGKCRFCGEEIRSTYSRSGDREFWSVCHHCEASGPIRKSKKEALTAMAWGDDIDALARRHVEVCKELEDQKVTLEDKSEAIYFLGCQVRDLKQNNEWQCKRIKELEAQLTESNRELGQTRASHDAYVEAYEKRRAQLAPSKEPYPEGVQCSQCGCELEIVGLHQGSKEFTIECACRMRGPYVAPF